MPLSIVDEYTSSSVGYNKPPLCVTRRRHVVRGADDALRTLFVEESVREDRGSSGGGGIVGVGVGEAMAQIGVGYRPRAHAPLAPQGRDSMSDMVRAHAARVVELHRRGGARRNWSSPSSRPCTPVSASASASATATTVLARARVTGELRRRAGRVG